MLYCHLLIVFTVKDSVLNLKESIGDLLSRVHTFNILKQQIATKAQFKKKEAEETHAYVLGKKRSYKVFVS